MDRRGAAWSDARGRSALEAAPLEHASGGRRGGRSARGRRERSPQQVPAAASRAQSPCLRQVLPWTRRRRAGEDHVARRLTVDADAAALGDLGANEYSCDPAAQLSLRPKGAASQRQLRVRNGWRTACLTARYGGTGVRAHTARTRECDISPLEPASNLPANS